MCGVLVVAALVLQATPAEAVDVYINGVLVTGVRSQEFEGVTVRLDAQGNVRIAAPQYRVERLDTVQRGPEGTTSTRTASPQPPTTPRPSVATPPRTSPRPAGSGSALSSRYWLVAQSSAPGQVQYQIEVRINDRLVQTFSDSDLPTPTEVTEFLRPGRNSIRISAAKIGTGGRRSSSSRDWLRVVIGTGHVEGTSVVIDNPRAIFTRNASQTDRASREYTVTAN